MSAVELGSVADRVNTTSGPDQISRRLEALPASGYVWRLVILLSLGGCFESTICSSPAISRRASRAAG